MIDTVLLGLFALCIAIGHCGGYLCAKAKYKRMLDDANRTGR